MRPISDGSIVIDTRIDSSGAEKGVKGLGGKLGSLAKGGLGLFVKGIAVAGTALAAAGIASLKLGSDLTEVQNVVDTTFGKNAGAINTWAKNAATSFGVGELAALKMNGTMGAMLKSMGMTSGETLNMSKGIVGLAGDFGSFYNLDTETAFEKIRSGMAGETEPLKALGINMSVANLSAYALSTGLTKSYKSMSEAEKTTLRYNYLMKVSADAQGDFAKTSGSLANQLRIAKLGIQDLGGAIGTALLPMAGSAMKQLNGFITTLKTAFDKGGFEGLASALGGVVAGMITSITAQLPKMVNMAVLVIQNFVTGLQSSLPAITTAAVTIITSLATGILTLLPQLLQMGLQIIINLALGIAQALPTLIPLAMQCLMSLINTLVTNLPLIFDAGWKILDGLAKGIIDSIPILIAMLPKIIDGIINYFVTCFPKMITNGVDILTALIDGLVKALPQLIAMLPQIIDSITTVISTSLPVIVKAAITILLAIINGLVTALPQLIAMLPRIIDSILNVITTNLPVILQAAITILLAIINGLVKALPQLIAMLPRIINTIIKVITDNLPMIINAAIQIMIALIAGLIQAIPQLIASVPKIVVAIVKAFADVNWGKIGIDILAGIGKGILAGVGSAVQAAKDAAARIKNSITGFFGINSPSRLMRDLVGKNLVKGIGVGIDVETPNLQKDIDKNLSYLTAKMQATVGYETAKTTAMVAAQHNYTINSGKSNVSDTPITQINANISVPVNLDGKVIATVIAPYSDTVGGQRQNLSERGLIL